MTRRRWVVVAVLITAVAVAAGVGAWALWRPTRATTKVRRERGGPGHAAWIGQRAPALELNTLDGATMRLQDLRGRPIVLFFWRSWCAYCGREIAKVNRAAREIPNAAVVGVSNEPVEELRTFSAGHGLEFRVASRPSLPAPFDEIEAVPTTVVVDAGGVIRHVRLGAIDFDQLQSAAR